MSRDRRRWEEPSSSRHDRSYYDAYARGQGWGHYAPPTELFPRRTFNYWQDEPMASIPHNPQRHYPYGRERQDAQWRDDSRSWHAESYSRRRRDFERGRSLDERDSWGDRSPGRPGPSQRNSSRHHYSTYTPPYIPRPTFRARSPLHSSPPFPEPAPPDPPRKASPPPSKPSQSLKPNPEYLSLSQDPSVVLRDPGMSCKLLILDLNGTLLIRSPRSRTSSGPQLRAVQPRPYMQSFRQYLFCAQTKAWLDTMVWSSAQPHSVDDMVDKVFGTTKNELKAVWNRKSLGLSEAEYHQKTLTTKDLTKPWDLFASALSPEKFKGHSAVPSQSQIIHSAFTTLLLDDSPHKAVLQPYNHVCIPEYGSARRRHDLQLFLATKEPKESKQNKKAKRKNQVETAAHTTNQTIPEASTSGALSESAGKEPYDAVLLAVIGILETIKLQSNVAGWIRNGGLWVTQERGVGALGVGKAEDGKAVSSAVVGTGNDASSTSDPAVTPEQAHLQTKMWFDDSSVVDYWIARGRRALMELDIQVVHGVTG